MLKAFTRIYILRSNILQRIIPLLKNENWERSFLRRENFCKSYWSVSHIINQKNDVNDDIVNINENVKEYKAKRGYTVSNEPLHPFTEKGESIKGNLILETFINSRLNQSNIQETIISLTEDMLDCGLPYILNNENYKQFLDKSIKNLFNFSADELLYFANLCFHNKTIFKQYDATFMVAFKRKMTEYTLKELFQLYEMIFSSDSKLCDHLYMEIINCFENIILNSLQLDLLSLEDLLESSRMCLFQPIKNTDQFFDYIIKRGLTESSSIFSYEQLYTYCLKGTKDSHSKLQFRNGDFNSLERAVKNMQTLFINNMSKYNTSALCNMLCTFLWLEEGGLHSLYNKLFFEELCYALILSEAPIFFKIHLFKICARYNYYSDFLNNEICDILRSKKYIVSNVSLIQMFTTQDENFRFHYIFKQKLLNHIDTMFDLLHLKILTRKSFEKLLNNVDEKIYRAIEEEFTIHYYHKLKLLSVLLPFDEKYIENRLIEKGMEATNNLLDVYSKSNYSSSMLYKLFHKNYIIPCIIYKEVGIIDYLIIINKDGYPINLEHNNVTTRTNLLFHSLDLPKDGVRIAVLTIKNAEQVMNKCVPIQSKKYLKSYLISEGFKVVYNFTFLPPSQQQYLLMESLQQAEFNIKFFKKM